MRFVHEISIYVPWAQTPLRQHPVRSTSGPRVTHVVLHKLAGAPDPSPLPPRSGATVHASSAPSWLLVLVHRRHRADKPRCAPILESGVGACLYVGHHPSPSRVFNWGAADPVLRLLGSRCWYSHRPLARLLSLNILNPGNEETQKGGRQKGRVG